MAKSKLSSKIGRHKRIRKKVRGNKERPRLSVYRSLKNIFCSIIDDSIGKTLLSVSTLDKELRNTIKYGGNIKAANALGSFLAKQAKAKGITKVCFDRGGYIYHGRIKSLAEAARKEGLEF
ncbi:MAG: 50S ribosomal protein L18 [Candidatus Omnitrophota bacterium]|nr:50S ribosomal protein L18 [Candidatus Omnitrophota bacterium]